MHIRYIDDVASVWSLHTQKIVLLHAQTYLHWTSHFVKTCVYVYLKFENSHCMEVEGKRKSLHCRILTCGNQVHSAWFNAIGITPMLISYWTIFFLSHKPFWNASTGHCIWNNFDFMTYLTSHNAQHVYYLCKIQCMPLL
jgi:hypothetical protein